MIRYGYTRSIGYWTAIAPIISREYALAVEDILGGGFREAISAENERIDAAYLAFCESVDLARQLARTLKRTGSASGTAAAETRQKGSPRQYSDDRCGRAQAEYDELRAKHKDSKGAWSEVSLHQGFPNGEAARAACYRYQKRNRAN